MAEESPFTEQEQSNQLEMLIDTFISLVEEKLKHPEWNEKIKKIGFRVNFVIPYAGFSHVILEKDGKYDIGWGKIENPIMQITATLENFNNFASRQLSSFRAIVFGKLKIKGKRHLSTLMNVGNVLRIMEEKYYEQ